jgi:predicted naringenin-chalcone synthase
MSTIRSTAVATPPHRYDQGTVLARVRRWLGDRAPDAESLLRAFDGGLVRSRASVVPLEEVFAPRTFEEKNRVYMEAAVDLGEQAALACLERAGVRPDEVDFFVSASCTGFMIPSLDAVLAHRLRMKPSLARLPITQHGCAGGAVALRQAHEHLLAHPGHKVLVLAAEIPTATFQRDDFSAENIISASLFGDGAAAALLTAGGPATAPRIFATDSRMFPDSADLMGFELRNSGLKIVLSKRVPQAIRAHAPQAIGEFLARHDLDIGGIDHLLIHPGGRRIIEGFEAAFALAPGELSFTRSVLARHGNLSSATILFILDEFRESGRGVRGDLGLLVAFGPGFGCESLLLSWGSRAPVPATEGEAVGALA